MKAASHEFPDALLLHRRKSWFTAFAGSFKAEAETDFHAFVPEAENFQG
jgi:hypothetical protein